MRIGVLLGLGVLAVISCKNPLEVSDCPDQLQITMSAGTTPEIDWTPRCHLHEVLLTTHGDRTVWSVYGPPQLMICPDDGRSCPKALNTLYPPIRYGVVPRGAYQGFPFPGEEVPPLNLGWPYAVYLSRANSSNPQEIWLAVDTFVVTAAPAPPTTSLRRF